MKKKFTFVIAMLLVVALAMPSSAAVFTDVSTDHWAYEAVNKLVAAGVIEGYPDGTFKGDESVTRYEIAMMVDRVLERVAEERASLEDEVDAMKDGFTSAQKTELEDVIKSIVEKNMPEPKEEESEDTEGLNEKEYEQIANLVEALTFNYKAELKNLGSDLEDVEDLIDANKEEVEATIAALEERVEDLEEPTVQFSGSTGVDMRVLETKGATPYINPFNVDNGSWYEKWPGANDNTYDSYINGSDYFYEWADIDVSINTDEIEANLNFETNDRYFGDGSGASFGGDSDREYLTIDNIGGTVIAPTWTADFGKGDTEVSAEYTDYLMYNNAADLVSEYYPWENTAAVDGVHLTADNGFDIIVGKSTEEVDENDDETTDYTYDKYTVAGSMPYNILGLDFTTYFGTERNNDLSDDAYELSEDILLGGMKMEKDFDPFKLTSEFAMSKEGDVNGHLFRLGAETEMGPVSLEGNYENTQDFSPIREAWFFGNTTGYDFTATSELGPVTVEGYYESYDDEPMMYGDVQLDSEMAGFEITGQFKQENRYDSNTDSIEFGQQLRNLTATTDMGMLTLTGEYDYEADDEGLEPYPGYGFTHKYPIDDGSSYAYDGDHHDITGTVEANLTDNVSASLVTSYALAEYDSYDPATQEWNTDTNTYDPTTVYATADAEFGIFSAYLGQELVGSTTAVTDTTEVSGTVDPNTMTLMGIDFDSKLTASYHVYEDSDNLYNLLADLDATYDATERFVVTGGYEYNRKYQLTTEEWRPDGNDSAGNGTNGDDGTEVYNLQGTLQTTTLGAEYTISDDVSATADYKHVDFAGDNPDDDYIVDEVKAGVSVSF